MKNVLSPEEEENLREEVLYLSESPDADSVNKLRIKLRVLMDEKAIGRELFDNANGLLLLTRK